MKKGIKRVLIGRPLKNEALADQKYGVLWGLPILSSDAISSVAYAGQEILTVLVPVIGGLAFKQLTYISAAIVGLLLILMLSYRQTIDCYPSGGGAYIVAKDNLGILAGVTAGAALSIDYIMTVAVSISSGVEQLATAFPDVKPYSVPVTLFLIILLMVGNLRGIRESAKMFGIPAYAFMFALVSMIITGFVKLASGAPPAVDLPKQIEPLTLFLILKAFSSGCAAVTGIEAVSNAVPNFKEVSTKNAKHVLLILSIVIFVLFGGTSILANYYPVNPAKGAVLVQEAGIIFSGSGLLPNIMYYFIVSTLIIILVLAANTAFSGFPMLISIVARDGYAPRQLSMRGDRLSYSNGILLLSVVAGILVIAFNAQVSKLIGLYAVGVFISFTLSQTGMFIRWKRNKSKGWVVKACINGLGAIVTGVTVIIIAVAKFHEGSWIVVFAVPILVFLMLKTKRHYNALSKQLKITPEELSTVDLNTATYSNRVIVPLDSVNRASVRALRFAKTISDNVVAFHVSINEENAQRVKEQYAMLNTGIPLTVKYSPTKTIVDSLSRYIESVEYDYKKGDMITVLLPQFVTKKWWHSLLHNRSTRFIKSELLKHKHIVVMTMPLQLKGDDYVLRVGKSS